MYEISSPGQYYLQFGVANWNDTIYDSGLAFDGATIAGEDIVPTVPEPATFALLAVGFVGIAAARRRRSV